MIEPDLTDEGVGIDQCWFFSSVNVGSSLTALFYYISLWYICSGTMLCQCYDLILQLKLFCIRSVEYTMHIMI